MDLLRGLLNLTKKIDTKILPSQGLFYRDDFEISIKRADIEDIIEYEHNYIKDNVSVVISKLKHLVEKNIKISKGYTFSDIKSIDIIFLFFEIVKFTKGESIKLQYFDDEKGINDIIEFNPKHFNYFIINNELMKHYDNKNKEFIVNGYRYSLPSIGLENCLTKFLISKSNKPDSAKFNNYSYNFTFFSGDKNKLTFNQIENLIQIFNFDMEPEEKKKVRDIVKMFQPIQTYSLRKNGRVIDINSKIDLEKIWK